MQDGKSPWRGWASRWHGARACVCIGAFWRRGADEQMDACKHGNAVGSRCATGAGTGVLAARQLLWQGFSTAWDVASGRGGSFVRAAAGGHAE